MTQRATLPMILALLVTTAGFATLIFVRETTSPPLIYGAYYAGVLFGIYLFVRLWLPHSDVLLLPIVTLLTGLGLVMIFRLTYNVEGVENLATTQAIWILAGSAAMLLVVLLFRNYEWLFEYKYLFAVAAFRTDTAHVYSPGLRGKRGAAVGKLGAGQFPTFGVRPARAGRFLCRLFGREAGPHAGDEHQLSGHPDPAAQVLRPGIGDLGGLAGVAGLRERPREQPALLSPCRS